MRKLFSLVFCAALSAQGFQFPTANRTLLENGGGERFFVGTSVRPWPSGTFGCVRSDGFQMHEGLDIRALQRDARGEPTDAVMASLDGTVAYINKRSGTSNYGNYIVLRHTVDGLEVFTLYAHLSAIAEGITAGKAVKAGEQIATMGRTSNTRERISRERAHVHFEINFMVSDRFSTWYKKHHPKEPDDHGAFNGMNLIGIDPQEVLLRQHAPGARFSLLEFVKNRPELCRVLVRNTNFSWPKRYSALIRPNPLAQKEGVASYELALDFNGLPFQVTPRAASEFKMTQRYHLLSVNAAEQQRNPCRKLIVKRGNRWELTNSGMLFLDLLTQ